MLWSMYEHQITYSFIDMGHSTNTKATQMGLEEESRDGWELVSTSMHNHHLYMFWKREARDDRSITLDEIRERAAQKSQD